MIERPILKNRKRVELNTNIEVNGKLPPQAIDLEEAVLGAILLDKEALKDAMETLKPKHFNLDAHQYIYEAMLYLYNENKPVDILTVTEQLRQVGQLDIVGGPFYIAKLTNRVSSSAHVSYHSHIIIQKFIQRELIRISGNTISEAYEEQTDAFKLLDETEKNLYEVKNDGMQRSYVEIKDVLTTTLKMIESNVEKKDGLTGVPSGIRTLDEITAGWQKSDLIILAARPGMGKTALALSMMRNAAVDFKKSVAFFSLEMSAPQLVNRLIAAESEIGLEKLKKGQLENYEWEQITSKIKTFVDARIYIDDTPSLRVFDLKAKCRRLHSKHNLELVIVDYLQLMRGEDTAGNRNTNREQEIGFISRSLKGLAKELNIPIIALAQLSRDVEKRAGDKRPQLSDLRESGSIEQDADIVSFVWRPGYYDKDNPQAYDDGLGEIIIAKHRNGETKNAKVRYRSHIAKFESYEGEESDLENNGGTTTISLKSKVNTEDADDTSTKTDFYSQGLKNQEKYDTPPWMGDSDTGSNIEIADDEVDF